MWDEDPAKFVINAMSPAEVLSIVVDEDKKSMDISVAEMSLREVVVSMCEYTPIKTLPLHRDFRLHNILFGVDYYHLIDFDFAAYDDVSMEVMGMVVDLLQHGFEYVEAFLTAYIESSNIDTYDSMASNYLLYLATSSFPYDREEALEPQAFQNLKTERSKRLVLLYLNMDNLAKFFQNK
jgi:Ser/Thr protein kinase RdoA (MazF antagonist)